MTRPLILAVDDDPAELERAESALQRYGRDYRIRGEPSGEAARACLEMAQARGQPVALVLATPDLPDAQGPDLLASVHAMHPDAKRALLVPWGAWGDREIAETMLTTMARGQIDYYVLRPLPGSDELFHRTIAEFLHEWSRATGRATGQLTLVLPQREGRGADIRDLVVRNGVPHVEFDTDSPSGVACLRENGLEGAREPVVVVHGRTTLRDPTRQEVARALGVETDLDGDREFDVLVVGAGPAGLATAVYASSEGLSALVVERDAIGGQAGTSSLIRNYLGFSRGVSGAELAQRGYQQAWVFGTQFLLTREVLGLRADGAGQRAEISGVGTVRARAVVLAGGVAYRRLDVPSLERLAGAGVFYGASVSEAHGADGRAGLRRRRRQLRRAGRAASRALRRACDAARPRRRRCRRRMSQYLVRRDRARRRDRRRSRGTRSSMRGGDGWLERLVARATATPATTRGPRRRPVRDDRRASRTRTGCPPRSPRDDGGYLLTGAAIGSATSRPAGRSTATRARTRRRAGLFAVGDVRQRLGQARRLGGRRGVGRRAQLHEHLRDVSGRHAREHRRPPPAERRLTTNAIATAAALALPLHRARPAAVQAEPRHGLGEPPAPTSGSSSRPAP